MFTTLFLVAMILQNDPTTKEWPLRPSGERQRQAGIRQEFQLTGYLQSLNW